MIYPGSIINGVCTWQRKLRVTCINGSTVRIRIQTNGLPGRCASMPSTVSFVETNIDFEVNFNPDANVNSPYKTIVCSISSQTIVPSGSSYQGYSSSKSLNLLAGVAIDGMPILNVNSANQVDPFYPPSNYTREGVDQCLSHSNKDGTYHYHISSGCMISPPSGNINSCAPNTVCGKNIANFSLQSYPSSAKTLTVIGIAKDGHVIYGPYLSSGDQVKSGFDLCNDHISLYHWMFWTGATILMSHPIVPPIVYLPTQCLLMHLLSQRPLLPPPRQQRKRVQKCPNNPCRVNTINRSVHLYKL